MAFDENEGLNFLLYGDSGTGKTTLWSTFPGPILAIICSGGRKPGELRSINTPEMRKKVQTVTLTNPSELDDVSEYISSGAGKGKFGTIVLDHVSGFQDLKLMAYKGLKEIPQQKSFGIATKQDWGEIASQVKEHLVKLLSLSCNVVIVGQERVFSPKEDAEGNPVDDGIIKTKVGCALIPSITGWLNPACDYVIQTYKRPKVEKRIRKTGKEGTANYKETEVETRLPGVDFCARTEAHDVFMTKFRIPIGRKLPECIIDPTYQKIMDLVNGK